ncbi:MAG: hypothetical protein KKC03_06120 [Bacteroidetes bacterium]|nr:hypothetical protein [Bacteroidota bacterium]
MDKIAKIRSQLIGSQEPPKRYAHTGIVTAVEGKHCKVKLPGGLEVSNVKLAATIDEDENELLLVPKVGTAVVMISLTGTENNLTVIKADEVEYVSYQQDGLELLIDSRDGKLKVSNEQESLKDIFDKLIALLRAFKVHTPAGPSGTALADVVIEIDDLEAKFNRLLK